MKHLKVYLGILIMVILIVAGVYIPKLYSIVYDKNSLNQIEYLQMDINTYKYNDTDSFQERLKGIASYTAASGAADGGMNPIVLSVRDSYFDKDIIDNLQEQLNFFYEMKLLSVSEKISYEDILLMKLCAVYPDSFIEAGTSGITYWNIELNYGESYKMTVNVDTESGKIYFLKMVTKDAVAEEGISSFKDTQIWKKFMHYYGIDESNVEISRDAIVLYVGSNILECINYTGKTEDRRGYLLLGFSVFGE